MCALALFFNLASLLAEFGRTFIGWIWLYIMPLMAELEPAAAGRALKLGAWPAVEEIGGCSHDSEHDLAFMVSDFLENWSYGSGSRCSSDSDSGHTDLSHIGDKISVSFPSPKGSSFSSLSTFNLFMCYH